MGDIVQAAPHRRYRQNSAPEI